MSDPGEDFISKLEKLGEVEVRHRLAKSEYGTGGFQRPMVEAWLEGKAQLNARSAKIAAWIAAIAAFIAAVCGLVTVYLYF